MFPLFVAVEVISFVRDLTDVVIKDINVSATFECELSKPGLKMEWAKAEKTIKPNEKYEISMDGAVHRLVINDVNAEDVKKYTASYQSISTSANLTVQGTHTIILLYIPHTKRRCVVNIIDTCE